MASIDINIIKENIASVLCELLDKANLKEGDVLVLGCSSSEIIGEKIGTCSSADAAAAVYSVLLPALREKGIFLAAQCCEHLNRALVVEKSCAVRQGLEIVNVVPHPHAGGASATQAYALFDDPVMVENIKADAGIDIGGTLIGMHLRATAVPVKTATRHVGEAIVICARTRPKFIGGERAIYNENLL